MKPARNGPVFLFLNPSGQADRALMMEMNMRRVYLRRHFHYESMIGTTFKKLGDHLDTCCLMNTNNGGFCPARMQCRDWWDNQCKVAYPDLALTEIEEIIREFEESRVKWLRQSRSLSSGAN